MTTLDVLKAARAKVARGWTQNTSARDAAGRGVIPDRGGATCWCALAAIETVCPWAPPTNGIGRTDAEMALLRVLGLTNHPMSIVNWNDDPARTQVEVIAAFDEAIAAEEAKS